MNKEQNIIILYCLKVSVSVKRGCCARIEKYPCKKTDLNYIPVIYSEEQHPFEKGFHRLTERIKFKRLNKVEIPFPHREDSEVIREIYYLEGNESFAKEEIKKEISKRIEEVFNNASKLKEIWNNRHAK